MKIGIITFWSSQDNYGQILQCYSLYKVLTELGNEAYIIKYIPAKVVKRTFIAKVKNIIKWLLLPQKQIIRLRQKKETEAKNRQREFDKFKEKHLHFTPKTYIGLQNLQQYAPTADCYITGSDQVWAQPLSNKDNEAFFLNFGKSKSLRISYAPSFSMKNYPDELEDLLTKQLSRFDAISVREPDGVNICKKVGYNATLVLDPTLLINPIFFKQMINNNKEIHKYAFIYSLNINSEDEFYWTKIHNELLKLKIIPIATTASGYLPAKEILSGCKYIYPTIQDWLTYIYYSEIIITASFHGIVFAILFHKNFIYIPLKGKNSQGNNRILSLLESLQLSNCIYKETDNLDLQELLNTKIDWDIVDNILNQKRLLSMNFLQNALKIKK